MQTEVLVHEWEYKSWKTTKVTNAKLCDKYKLNKECTITQQLLLHRRSEYKVYTCIIEFLFIPARVRAREG